MQVDYADITYTSKIPLIFTGLEPTLAVALPCIPLLRPLLGHTKYSANGTARFGATMPSFVTGRLKKWETMRRNRNRNRNAALSTGDDASEREIRLTPLGTEHTTKAWRSKSHSQLGRRETESGGEGSGSQSNSIIVSQTWDVRQDSE